MIQKEIITLENGVKLSKSYSDKNVYIRQVETGAIYTEAVDIIDAPYTYEETDRPIIKLKKDLNNIKNN